MPSYFPPAVDTANDRFKQGFGRWFWIGLMLATAAHAGFLVFFPDIAIDDISRKTDPGPTVFVDPHIPPPEEPPAIPHPAEPVIGGPEVDPTLTISPTDLASNPPPLLPPPPGDGRDDPGGPIIVPMTIPPALQNTGAVRRLLERHYPPILRDAGIGGTVHVWFHIDEDGRVIATQLNRSSGYGDLDAAALRVADAMEFSPAWNRDVRVKVWVSVPITFEVRRD